ncbi:MAG: hypothetical protein ACFB9M_16075 [Myxococcota bacterium]
MTRNLFLALPLLCLSPVLTGAHFPCLSCQDINSLNCLYDGSGLHISSNELSGISGDAMVVVSDEFSECSVDTVLEEKKPSVSFGKFTLQQGSSFASPASDAEAEPTTITVKYSAAFCPGRLSRAELRVKDQNGEYTPFGECVIQ